ncbi:MAG: hypothetical protein GY777_27530 [Candidatus Brocadiaceae bacterium]|nr:hypothetical protein [Candidatus Brocadiaceae bacterium]
MKILFLIIISFLIVVPQSFAGEENPEDGLKNILILYKEKKFEKLIKERYTEIYKAEEAGKVNELIQKFSNRFANEKKLNQVIAVFETLVDVKPNIVDNPMPRITETDKMAKFQMENGEFKLYLQKSGKWGFHM